MKKLIPNILVLMGLTTVFIGYLQESSFDSLYFRLLTNARVLNIALVLIAIAAGFFVKNYTYVLAGSTMALVIYCFTVIFQTSDFDMKQYFLAIYTIFLAFSVLANFCRHFKEWMLTSDDGTKSFSKAPTGGQ
jgi:hypothetical protein